MNSDNVGSSRASESLQLCKEYDWYANADLSEYAGKWVIILNNKVICSGKSVKEMLDSVKKEYPDAKPLVAKVPHEILMVL